LHQTFEPLSFRERVKRARVHSGPVTKRSAETGNVRASSAEESAPLQPRFNDDSSILAFLVPLSGSNYGNLLDDPIFSVSPCLPVSAVRFCLSDHGDHARSRRSRRSSGVLDSYFTKQCSITSATLAPRANSTTRCSRRIHLYARPFPACATPLPSCMPA